jgi:hypothetical protein
MKEMKYELLAEVNDRSEADVIESFLEAEGIDVELVEESVTRSAYTISFAPIQIFVPKDMLLQARDLLKSFNLEQSDD